MLSVMHAIFKGTYTERKAGYSRKEYGIPLHKMQKKVGVMCNLSEEIVDDTKEEIIMNMYKNKFSLKRISVAIGKILKK